MNLLDTAKQLVPDTDEIAAARARSDAFLERAERDRRERAGLCRFERDIAMLPRRDVVDYVI